MILKSNSSAVFQFLTLADYLLLILSIQEEYYCRRQYGWKCIYVGYKYQRVAKFKNKDPFGAGEWY
jgi:hypothetical protein